MPVLWHLLFYLFQEKRAIKTKGPGMGSGVRHWHLGLGPFTRLHPWQALSASCQAAAQNGGPHRLTARV